MLIEDWLYIELDPPSLIKMQAANTNWRKIYYSFNNDPWGPIFGFGNLVLLAGC